MPECQEDVLFEGGGYPPLLKDHRGRTEFEVLATCRSVAKIELKRYGRFAFAFTFRIVEPHELEGVELLCYAPWREWKRKVPSPGAKIAKMAAIAAGNRKIRKITKAMFVNKLFRCRVKATKGDVPYSVVEMILAKEAG